MASFGIVVFPGTWSDRDSYYAVHDRLRQEARYIWHKERDLSGLDCVVLPGGFSYGDHLRTGAMEFRCQSQLLRVENENTPFTSATKRSALLQVPVSHGEGNYYADKA